MQHAFEARRDHTLVGVPMGRNMRIPSLLVLAAASTPAHALWWPFGWRSASPVDRCVRHGSAANGTRALRRRLQRVTTGGALRTAAEVGVGDKPGLGGTSFALARIFREVHLFDFDHILKERAAALASCNQTKGGRRFASVITHGNSARSSDSYAYSIKRLLRLPPGQRPVFDYVYIDAAHEWLHDGFAFLLLDKLLRPGGVVEFDDYRWTIAGSPTAGPRVRRAGTHTDEQMNEAQVKEVIDLLVKPNPRYLMVEKDRTFRKLRDET